MEQDNHYTDGNQNRYTDSPEYENLKDTISEQLFSINGHISTLKQFVSSLQSFLKKGTVGVKAVENIDKKAVDKIAIVKKHVLEIDESMKQLNLLDKTSLNRTQVISRDKLNRDVMVAVQEFRTAQIEFTKVMKMINDKARSTLKFNENSTALLQEEEVSTHQGIRAIGGGNQLTMQAEDRPGAMTLELDPINNEEYIYQQNLINQRDEEISNIQEGITDLNEIFKDLGTVVQQQGVMVDNIEANIYSAADNTNLASRELNKAQRYQGRSNKYCLYLLMVLSGMLFFLLLIIFI